MARPILRQVGKARHDQLDEALPVILGPSDKWHSRSARAGATLLA